MKFRYKNLSKRQFLKRNSEKLEKVIRLVNRALAKKYARNIVPVTKEDFWVLFNCEVGLTNGKVDPNYSHSEGERGLFPLPINIVYWNGDKAPEWNEPMSIEVNLFHFTLYMGHLKNRFVEARGGYRVYYELFRVRRIYRNNKTSAKLLAGVVHGYFLDGTYKGTAKAPIRYLVEAYKARRPLSKMMEKTKYIWAGDVKLKNRESNIAQALRWV